MHYEEENQRRRQHDRRPQGDRRRSRDEHEHEINDFRSRWDEPSSGILHPRERQWSDEGRDRYRERGDYQARGHEQEQQHSRGQRREQFHDRRNEHLFSQQPDYRRHERGQNEGFSRENQHANDRWYQEKHRYLDDRYPPEQRRRSRRDDEEWEDHRR